MGHQHPRNQPVRPAYERPGTVCVMGVDGLQHYSILGRRVTRNMVRNNRRTPLGMLLKLSKILGLRERHYFDCRTIGARTFREVVSEAVGVVNWWHSWPARPVNGFAISDRLYYWRAARHDTVSSSAEVQKKMTGHLRVLGHLD